jgi:hypothetical protein
MLDKIVKIFLSVLRNSQSRGKQHCGKKTHATTRLMYICEEFSPNETRILIECFRPFQRKRFIGQHVVMHNTFVDIQTLQFITKVSFEYKSTLFNDLPGSYIPLSVRNLQAMAL